MWTLSPTTTVGAMTVSTGGVTCHSGLNVPCTRPAGLDVGSGNERRSASASSSTRVNVPDLAGRLERRALGRAPDHQRASRAAASRSGASSRVTVAVPGQRLGRRSRRRDLHLDLVGHRFAQRGVAHRQLELVVVALEVRPHLVDERERSWSRPAARSLASKRPALIRIPSWPGPVAQHRLGVHAPRPCRCSSPSRACAPARRAGPGRRGCSPSDRRWSGSVYANIGRCLALDVHQHVGAAALTAPRCVYSVALIDVGARERRRRDLDRQLVALRFAGRDLAEHHLVLVEDRVVALEHGAHPVGRRACRRSSPMPRHLRQRCPPRSSRRPLTGCSVSCSCRVGAGRRAGGPVDPQLLQRLRHLLVLRRRAPCRGRPSTPAPDRAARLVFAWASRSRAKSMRKSVFWSSSSSACSAARPDRRPPRRRRRASCLLVAGLRLQQIRHRLHRLLALARAGVLEVPLVVGLAPPVRRRLQPDPGPLALLLDQQRIGLDVRDDADALDREVARRQVLRRRQLEAQLVVIGAGRRTGSATGCRTAPAPSPCRTSPRR